MSNVGRKIVALVDRPCGIGRSVTRDVWTIETEDTENDREVWTITSEVHEGTWAMASNYIGTDFEFLDEIESYPIAAQVAPYRDKLSSDERKEAPVYGGFTNYFPDAMVAVAAHSKVANDKHNPGEPLHWSKGKSNDHADCVARHLLDVGRIDPETGKSHTIALAWRAMALLQTELENNND